MRADRERLQQVFLNLFLNAADAMPEGGLLQVTLALHGDREVLVEVADTGTGIAEDDVEHIFAPFFTTKTAGEGNGLGLSVAQGIVVEHGGAITVESRPGHGTRFRVVLPLAGIRLLDRGAPRLRGLGFGMVTVRTPSAQVASTRSASASLGSVANG